MTEQVDTNQCGNETKWSHNFWKPPIIHLLMQKIGKPGMTCDRKIVTVSNVHQIYLIFICINILVVYDTQILDSTVQIRHTL